MRTTVVLKTFPDVYAKTNT